MIPPYTPRYQLKNTIAVLQGFVLALDNPRRLV